MSLGKFEKSQLIKELIVYILQHAIAYIGVPYTKIHDEESKEKKINQGYSGMDPSKQLQHSLITHQNNGWK